MTTTDESYLWVKPHSESFSFGEPLTATNFCELWRGNAEGIAGEVVLKLPRRDQIVDGGAVLDREIAVRQFVSSEHILPMNLSERLVDGRVAIALPYLPLGSLADRIERTEPPRGVDVVSSVARDIGSALTAIRDAGFSHSDATPGNILQRTAEPLGWLLADLGMAVPLGSEHAGLTEAYAPSALLIGDGEPSRAEETWDVVYLGKVLYELITGDWPEPGDDPGPPPTPSALELWHVIRSSYSGGGVRMEDFIEAAL